MPSTTRPDRSPLRPSRKFSDRTESRLSRRSSLTSFATANGISERNTNADFSSDDQRVTNDHDDDDDDDDDNDSSEQSPEPHFNRRQSADSLQKSPPTSHDDVDDARLSPTPRKNKSQQHLKPKAAQIEQDRRFLSPSPTPRVNKARRKQDRLSKASHLTLPYERSEAGDYDDRASLRIPGSRSNGRLSGLPLGEPFDPFGERGRSQSERGGSRRSSRLAPPPALPSLSVRSSYISGYAPSHQGSVSGSPRKKRSTREPLSPRSMISATRKSMDNMSITSRATARAGKAGSVLGPKLDAETQVFPGTKIRTYVEPTLTDSMRTVLRQFSGRNMGDHLCSGYPIAVFVGAVALDTGSLIHPHVSGGVSLYFGAGHPKNMATVLPEEDRIPSHIPNPKAPTPVSLSRRAELRAAITALETIYDLYRGRACAHICIDSAYVAKAWGTWIPTWEAKGWPGEEEDRFEEQEAYERHRRRRRDRDRDDWLREDPYASRRRRRPDGYASDRGSRRGGSRYRDDFSDSEDYSDYDDRRSRRGGGRRRRRDDYDHDRRAPPRRRPETRKLVDEDLLRELADIRWEFAKVERERLGSAHLYLIDRTHNPADRMARAAAKSDSAGLLAAAAAEEEGSLDSEDDDDDDDEYGRRDSEEKEEIASLRTSRSESRLSERGGYGNRASLALSSAAGERRARKPSSQRLAAFDEAEEDDARSIRSHRSRAEKERDRYLMREAAPPLPSHRYRDDESVSSMRYARSQPDLRRSSRRPPAPEDLDYDWDARSTRSSNRGSVRARPKQPQQPRSRQWTMQTAEDFEEPKSKSKKNKKRRDDDDDRRSIFSRMSIFGRKGK